MVTRHCPGRPSLRRRVAPAVIDPSAAALLRRCGSAPTAAHHRSKHEQPRAAAASTAKAMLVVPMLRRLSSVNGRPNARQIANRKRDTVVRPRKTARLESDHWQ